MHRRDLTSLIQQLALAIVSAPLAYVPAATAQSYQTSQEQSTFSQQELDQMLAPIALYPDALLAQILMAATYPSEIAEAARWSGAYPGLSGDAAVQAVSNRDWDPSVKSLVAFPQLLAMMSDRLEWTERLGDAFLMQESAVMDTVQYLRQQAYASGNLQSGEHIRVQPQGQYIYVEPAYPGVVFVPYYDPRLVYGGWRWATHPPVHWAPWSGYRTRPGAFVSFHGGSGIIVSTGYFFGALDWPHRRSRVVHVHPQYYGNRVHVNRRTMQPAAIHVPRSATIAPEPRRYVPERGSAAIPQRIPHRAEPAPTIAAQPPRVEPRSTPARIESRNAPRTETRMQNSVQSSTQLSPDARSAHRHDGPGAVQRHADRRERAAPVTPMTPTGAPATRATSAAPPMPPPGARHAPGERRAENRQERQGR